MAHRFGDRIQETAGTSGLADFALVGAVTSYRAISSFMTNGDTCSYLAIAGSQWEVGVGTYNAGVLERTSVEASSSGGSKVNFSTPPNVLNTWTAADAAFARNSGRWFLNPDDNKWYELSVFGDPAAGQTVKLKVGQTGYVTPP